MQAVILNGRKPLMNDARLERVLALIDAANAKDPNIDVSEGIGQPRELVYGRRMSAWLDRLSPGAPALLQIAARGQHIRRWEVPRDSYPATREGYLKWRSYLYGFHGKHVAALMVQAGYEDAVVQRVKTIIQKRGVKTYPEVQAIEDVACLVFLEHYFENFAATQDTDKLIAIMQKTWKKMSDRGHELALTMPLPEPLQGIVAQALEAV
jgi:hypothetical protein